MKTFTSSTGNPCLLMDYGKSAINANDITYIEGDGNYSNIKLRKGQDFTSSFTLRTFKDKLNEDIGFFSPRKGLLINLNYLNEIVERGSTKFAKMEDGKELSISRRRGRELIDFLKSSNWGVTISV